jgi:hypothetical protein
MKLSVRPGKKDRDPKTLFDAPIGVANIRADADGGITMTIVADDIYTAGATHRFSITLTPEEVATLCRAAANAVDPGGDGEAA